MTAFIRFVLRCLLRGLYRVKVRGLVHYKALGPRVMIVSNHVSYLDALLLGLFLPGKVSFAINTHVANERWIKWFTALTKVYTIDPTNPMSTKTLIEAIAAGEHCVIFPEGRLTMTGAIMKVYEGPGMIADEANSEILPVRIEGAALSTFSRLKGIHRRKLFPKISIRIEKPIKLQSPSKGSAKRKRQYFARQLYDLMTHMMFESSHYKTCLFKSLIDASMHIGKHTLVLEDLKREPISYKTLITRSFVLGNALAKRTHHREIVGMLLPNSIGTVICLFALLSHNRTPAMLNYTAGIKGIVQACIVAKVKTILTSKQFIEAAQLQAHLQALEQADINVYYLEDIVASLTLTDKVAGKMYATFPRLAYRYLCDDLRATEPGVVLFTSGSEGSPKGVVLSHENISANRQQLCSVVDFNRRDVVFNALPIFHSFGLTAGLMLPLLTGLKTVLYPTPLHYRVIPEIIYDTNATILYGTDTFLSAYAKNAHNYDFYSIRYIFAGAEKLHEGTYNTWNERFGKRIFEGYGATETAPVLCVNTPMFNRKGTVGRLLPGIEYQIAPVQGISEGGRLLVRGPNIMIGYYRESNPGQLEPLADGWYDTGDIVTVDEEDYISIIGRAKRFAKIAGEMVSLTAVEQAINALWPESLNAAMSVSDNIKGEKIVLMTDCREASLEAIRQYYQNEQISTLYLPKSIQIVNEFPVLGTGKIDYVSLTRLVVDNE